MKIVPYCVNLVQALEDKKTKLEDTKATPLFLSNKSSAGNTAITLD
jgi:hypothetical protein